MSIPSGIYDTNVQKTISAAGSSAMEFYKCAAVYGPEEVVCYEVSGCPDATYNGRYLPTEFETSGWDQTYIVYKHETNNAYYFYNEGYGEFGLGSDYEAGSFTYRGSVDSSWYDSDWMTVEGMSMTESTTLINTDVPKTWDGYKAVLDDGFYTFESEITTGLTYSENKPEILKVYSADVSVKADWLYDGNKFSKGLIFHAPLTDRLDYAETGQMLENHGVQLTTLDGVKCARFDGSSFISLPNSLSARLSTGNSPLTIILNFRGDKQTGSILQCHNSGGNIVMIRLNDNSRWQFKFLGREFGDYTVGSFYEPNRWWTVVISSNINGKEAGCVISKTIHAKNNSPLPTDFLINAMYIGTHDGRTDSSAFTGYIKDVRIYDRAFTYEEACEYVDRFGFSKTEAVFSAPLSESATTAETGQTLTVSGNVTYGTVDGISCATFDGNSGINFPDTGMPAGTSARTLSCWFKINSIETNSNPALFGYGVRENGKFCGLFIESDGKVVFSGYNEQNHLYSPAGAVSVGKWYHVAAVKNGASEKLYINGVKVAEGTTGKNTELALGTIAYTTDTTAHKFNGSLAACRIYNGALSDSEIAELAEEFAPESSGDSSKQTAYTVSGSGTEIANGDYYDTGRTGWENDYPIYSNDKGCYLTYFAEYWRILNAEQFDNDSAEIDMYETATAHEEYHSDPSKAWWPESVTVAAAETVNLTCSFEDCEAPTFGTCAICEASVCADHCGTSNDGRLLCKHCF